MVNGPLMSARWSPDVGKKAVGTPNAPSISEVNEASGQLTVTWTAPTSNGGSAITDYEVSATDGANTVTDTTGDDSLTLALSGLTNGSSYTITVRAKNSDFWSTSSSPSGPHTAPDAPGPVSGLALAVSAIDQLTATWSAPVDNGGSAVTSYQLQHRLSTGSWSNPADITTISGATRSR